MSGELLAAVERERLTKEHDKWMRWGPYVSERQWGTVREDYSHNGDAWASFSYSDARSRAFRWGEDGIGGVSDDHQRLCLAVSMWNGVDPHLKERLFALTNGQGNHGEDVKEAYYHVDATPSHSYLRFQYKYPQTEFPYQRLIDENGRRTRDEPEFELVHTGCFDEDRYWDVVIEFAKDGPNDILMLITAHNRGPEAAELHLLPTLWFRNTWSWRAGVQRPELRQVGRGLVEVDHRTLGRYHLHVDGDADLLFCDNDTNGPLLYGKLPEPGRFYKDGIHEFVVKGNSSAVNPDCTGTKLAAHFRLSVDAGRSASASLRLRETPEGHHPLSDPFLDFDGILRQRIKEADAFYEQIQTGMTDEDAKNVQRQAYAGLIWGKQFFYFNTIEWLAGDPAQPPPPPGHNRNADWTHLNSYDILSMPDKMEYSYFCVWDTAFHMIPYAMIDAAFAKEQLLLMTKESFMHPSGQLAAYEWDYSDTNPPVHAWATMRVYQIDRRLNGGQGDRAFLERVFHKLLLNFTWWINKKDATGKNVFQGGFLGLDNIGVFDRSKPLPTGGFINQADGTAWIAFFSLTMMRIALELAQQNPVYQDLATKFFEHFLYIAKALFTNINSGSDTGLWHAEDEFYYDKLTLPGGHIVPLRVRSMVGLVSLFAVETLDPELLATVPDFTARMDWFLKYSPELASLVSRWDEPGRGQRRLLSLLRGSRLKKILKRMLDETEFLSEYGIRSLSKAHEKDPFVLHVDGQMLSVEYWPADSRSGMFGGNSNWRGPIWLPVNYLLIESLQRFHHYFTDDFRIECPTGSRVFMNLEEVSEEITRRLCRLFLRDERGRRTLNGDDIKASLDPHFKDLVLFPEFFDGDNGRGLGATHQTGWTALIARLLRAKRRDAEHEKLPTG
ncbi:Six-hairpin glycosidase-like protein [Hyaloraphidium curvatum]|nr:Six-hairpin glycosidase-like protein [Hyaloraphidium curvatum]